MGLLRLTPTRSPLLFGNCPLVPPPPHCSFLSLVMRIEVLAFPSPLHGDPVWAVSVGIGPLLPAAVVAPVAAAALDAALVATPVASVATAAAVAPVACLLTLQHLYQGHSASVAVCQ